MESSDIVILKVTQHEEGTNTFRLTYLTEPLDTKKARILRDTHFKYIPKTLAKKHCRRYENSSIVISDLGIDTSSLRSPARGEAGAFGVPPITETLQDDGVRFDISVEPGKCQPRDEVDRIFRLCVNPLSEWYLEVRTRLPFRVWERYMISADARACMEVSPEMFRCGHVTLGLRGKAMSFWLSCGRFLKHGKHRYVSKRKSRGDSTTSN